MEEQCIVFSNCSVKLHSYCRCQFEHKTAPFPVPCPYFNLTLLYYFISNKTIFSINLCTYFQFHYFLHLNWKPKQINKRGTWKETKKTSTEQNKNKNKGIKELKKSLTTIKLFTTLLFQHFIIFIFVLRYRFYFISLFLFYLHNIVSWWLCVSLCIVHSVVTLHVSVFVYINIIKFITNSFGFC